MRSTFFISLIAAMAAISTSKSITIRDAALNVRYTGFVRNGVEVFLNIKYGEDTAGENRFKPPRPFRPSPGSTINALIPGPACPQALHDGHEPLFLRSITNVSEDCLNLNIVRPAGITDRRLPVMVWLHGGGFTCGSNNEITTMPDALIRNSVEIDYPIMHVAINFRLGVFGFAQSEALRREGSENAGLRDQRLAIEWVRDNIGAFGGDPGRITIFGQSSGGLSVALQLMAYGGTESLPFQQGICQSKTLEPGITGNSTIDAMTAVVENVGCNITSVHSEETIACLRKLDTNTLVRSSLATYRGDALYHPGDIWLPSVDGDFLPAPASQLAREGRFGDAKYIIGWTQDDGAVFTDTDITTAQDTREFLRSYIPAMPNTVLTDLLSLYPVGGFIPPLRGTKLSAEFYRAARIFRDIVMVCPSMFMAESINNRAPDAVWLYNFNETILGPIFDRLFHIKNIGVVHTSEIGYVYANLSHWNRDGWPFVQETWDETTMLQMSRSWAIFATTGSPSTEQTVDHLGGWVPAYAREFSTIFINIGGLLQGVFDIDGFDGVDEITSQRFRERCDFINAPENQQYLQF